ncbi:hypothetical protein BHE74_00053935 [Ensete ventricosum]|nr:hypothetical protein BHE74_00053935 [Ensete ventricosum]
MADPQPRHASVVAKARTRPRRRRDMDVAVLGSWTDLFGDSVIVVLLQPVAGNNVMEELQMLLEHHDTLRPYSTHLGGVNNATVFSDPQSELTCFASGTRKRAREEPPAAALQSNLESILPPFCYPNLAAVTAVRERVVAATISAPGCHQTRLLDSGGTSTSGRPASPLTQDLVSHLSYQNAEIDELIRLQRERLRSGLEEVHNRHCKALLWCVEQRVAKRLREEEAELEKARRRNAELEETVRQLTAETEMWFGVAKNNESVAASLRANLEQVLLHNAAAALVKEGYGDTDDDAQSCRSAVGDRRHATSAATEAEEVRRWPRKACRSCGERDVCVLLLPCRHLCLCKSCESLIDACPVCGSAKNACLQIVMSG